MRAGYFGPEGTHTQEALLADTVGLELETVPLPTIHDTVMAVHEGTVDQALVPIENSLEGSVNATLDALAMETDDVAIVGEVVHPIRHCLIARRPLELAQIETIVSHPQASAQCARFIRTCLPGARVLAGSSTADAVRTVAEHCQGNGQQFLMETGQETPTTMSRIIHDVALPSLGVGLDTANLILYGKANPVDAVDILGTHIRSIHAKDGHWPTDPGKLGEEVLIGKGLVDFRQVFTKLHRLGYTGAVTIERETSGPQQIEDVRQEKIYLERIINEVTG